MFGKRILFRQLAGAGPRGAVTRSRRPPALPWAATRSVGITSLDLGRPRIRLRGCGLAAAALLAIGSPVAAAPHVGTLGLGIPSAASAEVRSPLGIRVQPPAMWIPNVSPGHEVCFPAPITVQNTGTERVTYSIEPIAASTLGVRKVPGFVDIPDPSWCKPEHDTITLEPDEVRSVTIRLHVPDNPCQFNRHWRVAFSVQTTSAGTVGAAAYPCAYIETISAPESPCPPEAIRDVRALSLASPRGTGIDSATVPGASPLETSREPGPAGGCLIVTPGILDAGDVPAGSFAQAGPIKILNGYDEDIRVDLQALVPDTGRLTRSVLITPGYTWMREKEWLQTCEQSFLLPVGKEARFEITVASPADSTVINYRWEGFISVNGPDGPEALVRVHWRTTGLPAPSGLVSRRAGGGAGP